MLEKKYTKKQIEELEKYFEPFFSQIEGWMNSAHNSELNVGGQLSKDDRLAIVKNRIQRSKEALFEDLKHLKETTKFYQFHDKFLPSILDYEKISRLSDPEQDLIIKDAEKRMIQRYFQLLDPKTNDEQIRNILKDLFLADGERPDNRYKNYAKNLEFATIINQIKQTREILKSKNYIDFSILENFFQVNGVILNKTFLETSLLNFLLEQEHYEKGQTPTTEEFDDFINFIKKQQDKLEKNESSDDFNLFNTEKLWFKQETKPEIRIRIEKKQQELEEKIKELKKQQKAENEKSTSWFSTDWIPGFSKENDQQSLEEMIQKFQEELKTLQETQKLLEYQQYCLEGYIISGKKFLNRMNSIIPNIDYSLNLINQTIESNTETMENSREDTQQLEAKTKKLKEKKEKLEKYKSNLQKLQPIWKKELNDALKIIEDLKLSQQNNFEILTQQEDVEEKINSVSDAFSAVTRLDMPYEDKVQLALLNDTMAMEKILVENSIKQKAALPLSIEDYNIFSNLRTQFFLSQIQYAWEQQLKFSKLKLISKLEVLNQNDEISEEEKDEWAKEYLKQAEYEIQIIQKFDSNNCSKELVKRLNEENKRIKEKYDDSKFLSELLKKDFPNINRKVLFQLYEKYSKLEQTDNLAKEIYKLFNDDKKIDTTSGNFTSEKEIEDMFYWNLFHSSDETAKENFFNYVKNNLRSFIEINSQGIKDDFLEKYSMKDFDQYLNIYWNYFQESKNDFFYNESSNFFNLSHAKQLQEEENWEIESKNSNIDRIRIISGEEEEVIISKLEAMYKDESLAKKYTEEIRKRAKNIHEIWKSFNNEKQKKSNTEEIRKRLAWIKKFVELPHKKQPIDRNSIDSNFEKLKEEFPWMEEAIDRIKEDIIMSEDVKEGQKVKIKVICFDGEPGIGKTEFASKLAAAINVPFGKISVAGEKDEKVVKGTAYSYVSSTESKIAQELIIAGVTNPVILLDELEKSEGESFEHTLLPLLNKSDSKSVEDKFFEVGLDYSNVYFIATTNVFADIRTEALKGRLELFEIPSPTDKQKLNLFKKEFIKNINNYGKDSDNYNFFEISDEMMEKLFYHAVSLSDSEEGIRGLLNQNARIAHKFFTFKENNKGKSPFKVTEENLKQILPKYKSTFINPLKVKSTWDNNTLSDEFQFEGVEFLQVNKYEANQYYSEYYSSHPVTKAANAEKLEEDIKKTLVRKTSIKRTPILKRRELNPNATDKNLKEDILNVQLNSTFKDDKNERDKFLESRYKTFQGRNHLKLNFSKGVTEYISLNINGTPTLFPGENIKNVNPQNPNYDPVNTLYNLDWREQKTKNLVQKLKVKINKIVVAHQTLKTLPDTHDKPGNRKEIALNELAEHIFGLNKNLLQAFSHNQNDSSGKSTTTTESENLTAGYEITTKGTSMSLSGATGNNPMFALMPSTNSSTSYHPSVTTNSSSTTVTSSNNAGSSKQVLISDEDLEKIILDALEKQKELIVNGKDKTHKDALKDYELFASEYRRKFGKEYSSEERIILNNLKIDIPWEQYFKWIEDEWNIIKENMEKYQTLSPVLFEDIQKNVLDMLNGFVKNDNLTEYWKVKLQYLACDMYQTLEEEYSRNPSLFKAMPNNLIQEYKKKHNKNNIQVDLNQDESKNMLQYYNIMETCQRLMKTTDLEFYTKDEFLKRLYEFKDLKINDLDKNSQKEYDKEIDKLKTLIKKGANLIKKKISFSKEDFIDKKVLEKLNKIIDKCDKQKKLIKTNFNRRILLPLFLSKKENYFRIYHLPESNKNGILTCMPFNSSKDEDRFKQIREFVTNIKNDEFLTRNAHLMSYLNKSRLRRANSVSLEDTARIIKMDPVDSQKSKTKDPNFQGVFVDAIFSDKNSTKGTRAIIENPTDQLPCYRLEEDKSLLDDKDSISLLSSNSSLSKFEERSTFTLSSTSSGSNQKSLNERRKGTTSSSTPLYRSAMGNNGSEQNPHQDVYNSSESLSQISSLSM